MRWRWWALAGLLGCDGDPRGPDAVDAAADARVDAGADGGADGGADARADGGCRPGADGCACADDPACDDGLVCDEATCRPARRCADAPCLPGQVCQDVPDADAVCSVVCPDGFTFDPAQMRCVPVATCADLDCAARNRTCRDDPPGARCGACLAEHTDEGGALAACRPLVTCAELACEAAERTCEATPGADATCGGCRPGFAEVAGACRPVDPCSAERIAACAEAGRACADGACGACLPEHEERAGRCEPVVCDGARCAALGRACAGASCGACLGATRPLDPDDPLSPCAEVEGCLPEACPEGLFCVPAAGAPVCEPSPCAAGEALRREVDANGDPIAARCVACEIECGAEGETGRLWPMTIDDSDECVCETLPGFYYSDSENRAERCDADGDGWVRLGALAAVQSRHPALRDNARCEVRTLDRVVLVNEFRQALTVHLCREGAQVEPCPEGLEVLSLVESVDLDDSRLLAGDPALADGVRGRPLVAAEVNALTKACVRGADYNRDGFEDPNHHQALVLPGLAPELRGFLRFAYFTELHTARWLPPVPTAQACDAAAPCASDQVCAAGRCRPRHGAYEIQEKSRCDADFPLRYLPADGDGWQQCTRNRDAAFSADASEPVPLVPVGFDFAAWSCDRLRGTCPVPPPPADPPADDAIPPHGLCEVPLPPADGVWRGMNHHSQFKCTTVLAPDRPVDGRRTPQALPAAALDTGRGEGYLAHRCAVACPADDPTCQADCVDGRCGTAGPVLACRAEQRPAVAPGDVLWTAVRFGTEGGYQRGCIDEWRPGGPDRAAEEAWRRLCPGYVENPRGAACDGNPQAFGRLLCGCGLSYGGRRCELGCPGARVGGVGDPQVCPFGYCVTGTPEAPGRQGYWMCGELSGLRLPAAAPEGFSVPAARFDGIERQPMCSTAEDCDSGWRVR